MEHRHSKIDHRILCVSQGLIMERLEMTLDCRIAQSSTSPINSSTQERWIQQLTDAVAWPESLSLVHLDLRPANILLDVKDNIKVGEFDATVKSWEELVVASEPFCKLDEDFEPPLGGPVSEQFSLGSFIYTLRFRYIPFHNLNIPNMVRKLIINEFPSIKDDPLFGDIIHKCWHSTYNSISKIADDIFSRLRGRPNIQGLPLSQMGDAQSHMLLLECEKSLAESLQDTELYHGL